MKKTTRNFADVIRVMLEKDPKLAFAIEKEHTKHNIAQLLYDNRKASKKTYKAIGKAVGLSADDIESIEESDYQNITLDLLQRLAGVFNKKLVVSFEE